MSIHRVDVEGTQRWYNSNKKLHREDGPAAIFKDGTQVWYADGECHRTDGPAVICTNGSQYWYVRDRKVCGIKDFQQTTNLTDEEITILILKYGDIK